ISRSPRSDLPAPEAPRSRTARPSIAIAVAWRSTRSVAAGAVIAGRSRLDRQADQKARSADHPVGVGPVLRPDTAAMRLDDLFRDRQPEPGMRAEFLASGPLAVETVEDRGQLVLGDAGALVFNRDENGPPVKGGM